MENEPTLEEDLETVALRIEIPGAVHRADVAQAIARIRTALADWMLVKDEPVVQGRLAVIKAAQAPKQKRMVSVGRFPITPVDPNDDRLAAKETK